VLLFLYAQPIHALLPVSIGALTLVLAIAGPVWTRRRDCHLTCMLAAMSPKLFAAETMQSNAGSLSKWPCTISTSGSSSKWRREGVDEDEALNAMKLRGHG
jgi:hypothetical protein